MNFEQGELFTAEECDGLQNEIIEHYQPEFERNKYIFVEDSPCEISDEPVKRKGIMQDDLFSVIEIEKQNEAIQQQKHEKEVEEAQKKMILPFFENPINDDQKLFNYQFLYIRNHDEEAWGKLIELSYEVTKRLIWEWLAKHRDTFLDDLEQDEKCMVAIHYVLRRYKKNVGWFVKKNFIGALKGGVIHAMRYETTLEKNTVSLEDENAKHKAEIQNQSAFL